MYLFKMLGEQRQGDTSITNDYKGPDYFEINDWSRPEGTLPLVEEQEEQSYARCLWYVKENVVV